MSALRIAIRHRHQKEPVLWVIDSEQWPRACLRAELIERGYDPYGFITIREALDSLSRRPRTSKPELIVLELRGQDLTAQVIEAVRSLRIPTIVLGGAEELNEPLVQAQQWQIVLKRPVSLGNIADAVEEIIPIPPHRVLEERNAFK
jgi:DNA-binding NtrC family response regulator